MDITCKKSCIFTSVHLTIARESSFRHLGVHRVVLARDSGDGSLQSCERVVALNRVSQSQLELQLEQSLTAPYSPSPPSAPYTGTCTHAGGDIATHEQGGIVCTHVSRTSVAGHRGSVLATSPGRRSPAAAAPSAGAASPPAWPPLGLSGHQAQCCASGGQRLEGLCIGFLIPYRYCDECAKCASVLIQLGRASMNSPRLVLKVGGWDFNFAGMDKRAFSKIGIYHSIDVKNQESSFAMSPLP